MTYSSQILISISRISIWRRMCFVWKLKPMETMHTLIMPSERHNQNQDRQASCQLQVHLHVMATACGLVMAILTPSSRKAEPSTSKTRLLAPKSSITTPGSCLRCSIPSLAVVLTKYQSRLCLRPLTWSSRLLWAPVNAQHRRMRQKSKSLVEQSCLLQSCPCSWRSRLQERAAH